MAQNSTDAAAEAIKYGRIVILNEELMKKNKALLQENAELETSIKKMREGCVKEEAALQDLANKANEARKYAATKRMEITAEHDAKEKALDIREQAFAKKEKAVKKSLEEVALREENATIKENGFASRESEITKREIAVKAKEDLASVEIKEIQEAADLIKRETASNKATLRESQKIFEIIEQEKVQTEALKAATKVEIDKLQDLTGKMRNENEVNAKIKQQMEVTIPKLHNLILVLREFQDFISSHMKNPDAIDAKFQEISKQLDIAVGAKKEVPVDPDLGKVGPQDPAAPAKTPEVKSEPKKSVLKKIISKKR